MCTRESYRPGSIRLPGVHLGGTTSGPKDQIVGAHYAPNMKKMNMYFEK